MAINWPLMAINWPLIGYELALNGLHTDSPSMAESARPGAAPKDDQGTRLQPQGPPEGSKGTLGNLEGPDKKRQSVC